MADALAKYWEIILAIIIFIIWLVRLEMATKKNTTDISDLKQCQAVDTKEIKSKIDDLSSTLADLNGFLRGYFQKEEDGKTHKKRRSDD
jgi:hypothetical protein